MTDTQIYYFDHSRNAIGHIKDEENAVQIAEDTSLGLIVFYATLEEIRMAVEIPSPEANGHFISNEMIEADKKRYQAMREARQREIDSRPANYDELVNSEVYVYRLDDYAHHPWCASSDEYAAQQKAADDLDRFIYFFWETDVPEKYLGLRDLVKIAMNDVDGYEWETPSDENIDHHTNGIVDWIEENHTTWIAS